MIPGFTQIFVDLMKYRYFIYYGRGTLKWVAYNPIVAIVAREMMIDHQIWYLFLCLYRKSKCLRVAESKSKPNHCYFLRVYSLKFVHSKLIAIIY